jgi:hypothetical protein
MIVSKTSAEKRLGKKLKSAWPKGSGKRSYYLLSSTGEKNLGGPYKTKEEALDRERQVQYFKSNPDLKVSSDMKGKKSKDAEKIKRSVSSRKNPEVLNKLYIKSAVESDFYYREDRGGNNQKYGLQSSVIGQLCPTNVDDEVYVAQYRTALDEIFFVRIEHSESEGWTANVFEKQRTPFLSQLIERDELVNLLDDAVDYMKYLGTSESYIERSDRLTDDELIEHWAVWYTWYRLVPWMLYPGKYKNPRYKECRHLWSYEKGNYFAEDEYLYGPYVPTVGYGDYDLGSVSLDYPVKRWREIRDGKEIPWNVDSAPNEMAQTNAHIMLVYENESNFAEWVTRDAGGVRVPRPDAMTLIDDADLIGNLTGPLSPFGAFFEKGAGGLSYYWKGVVDYGEPPGEDTVRLQEEEAKRFEGRGGAAGVQLDDEFAGGPAMLFDEPPTTKEDVEEMSFRGGGVMLDEIPPGEEGSDWEFISNPRPSREGFIPGFTYQLSDIGQAKYVIAMWLNRYYLKSESLRRSDIGGAFRPETKPSLMGFSSDGQYQMWDSIGFAHETMLLTRTPGGDWERGGAPSSVTKAQKSRRAKVAPYQRADDTEKNPSVLRGQQFDYMEFYVEAVNFTKPLTWVKASRTPEGLATNIRDAIKRASRLSNPSQGAYSEARGMSEIPNIVGEAMREFSGQNSTRLFNFDRAKTMAEVDNKARGVRSNIPGASYVDESGKVPLEPCQAGDYYLITDKESKRSAVYEVEIDPSDASKCILFRNEIGKEFEEQPPISRKDVRKYRNVKFMRVDKDIFTPGPDGTPVFVEIKDLLTLNYFSDNPEVKRDLVDEIRLHNANEKIADIVWVKQGGGEPKDKGWFGWVQLPSGAGLQVPMEELMLGLRPYGYSGKEYYWDDRLLNRGGVDLDSEEREYLINRWQKAMYDYSEQVQEGQSTGMSGLENPSRNPCLGLHVHSDDLDKIKSLVETRQNPGFVSRMVKKHKKLEG